MRALVTTGPRTTSLADVPEPERTSGLALVRIQLALLTRRDARVFADPAAGFPLVQGGAAAGIVESGGGLVPSGSRVVVWPRIACGRCDACRARRSEACREQATVGIDREGSLAEYLRVPRVNLIDAPDGLGPLEAVAATCFADAWRLLADAGGVDSRTRLVVIGTGGLADRTRQLARVMEAQLVEPDGSTVVDVAVAVGTGIEGMVELLGPGGVIVVSEGGPSSGLDPGRLSAGRLRIVGGGPASRHDVAELLRWAATHDFEPPVSGVVPLADAHSALEKLADTPGMHPMAVTLR